MAGIAAASILDSTKYRDRRNKPRKAVLDLSLITVHLGNGGFGVMLDASEDGLGVQVMGGAPPGTDLKLAFEVPDVPQPVEGIGLVNWYDGRGRIGIKFRELKPTTQEAYRRWVISLPEPNTPEMQGEPASDHRSLAEQAHAIKAQIASQQLDFELVLQHLIERTVAMTSASGGAVAIESGSEMVCRASSGLAPEIGVSIDPSSALTSQCIRTAKAVCCDDTEIDPRVNREICRQLNLRSSLILPIVLHGNVKGVLELFSPNPNVFTDDHLHLLEQLARFIAEVMDEPRKNAAVAAVPAPETVRESRAVPEVPKAAVAAPIVEPPAREISMPAEQPQKSATSAADAKPAELDKILEEYKEEASRDPRIIPLVALLILAITIGIIWFYTRAQKTAAASPPVAVHPVAAKTVANTAALPPQQEIPMPIDSLPIRQVETAPVNPAPKTASAKQPDLPEDTVRPAEPTARQVPATTRREIAPEAPLETLSATGLAGAAQLGNVSFPTIVTTPKLRAQGVSGGMLLHRVEPQYPQMARRMRIAGDVQLAARVTKSGSVENVRRMSGSNVLALAAIDAVKQWRYQPYVVNGDPQEVDVSITLHFRLPD